MKENFYEQGCRTAMWVGEKWPEICRSLIENVELKCKEEITNLKAHYHKLKYELNEINSSLNAGPGERPQQVVAYNLKIGCFFLLSTLLLMGGESFLVVWTFDPFPEMGVKKYLISVAITILGFIIFERILYLLSQLTTPRNFHILTLFLAVAAGIMAVVALLSLAWVRGFLLKALIGSRMMPLTENTAAQKFYQSSGSLMNLLFAAMAVAFALGGALLMREAGERIAGSSSVLKLYKRKEKIQNLMTEIPSRMERLEALARMGENEFSRGATETLARIKRGEETRERHKDRWVLIALGIFIAVLLFVFIITSHLFARELVVVGLDVSVSELAVDYKGETEFAKNLTAIGERIVPNLGPDSDLLIMGITGNSLASPFYILRARTGKDPGYFGELLKREIQGISEEWGKTSRSLKATEKFTDIFGFLSLAAMTLESLPTEKRTLVMLSDMRHCTPTINLEKPDRLDPKLLEKLKEKIHIPNLEGTNIYIHGVHSFGKTVPDLYYHDLKKFWVDFISLTKGTLKVYSNLREINLGKERRQP